MLLGLVGEIRRLKADNSVPDFGGVVLIHLKSHTFDSARLSKALEKLGELCLINIWGELLDEEAAFLLEVLLFRQYLGDEKFHSIDFLLIHLLYGFLNIFNVFEAHKGLQSLGSILVDCVDLRDDDGLQLAEFLENLGQVDLPVLAVVGAVDLSLVLLKALDFDAVEKFAHFILGIGVLFLEHHLVHRLGFGELSLCGLLV